MLAQIDGDFAWVVGVVAHGDNCPRLHTRQAQTRNDHTCLRLKWRAISGAHFEQYIRYGAVVDSYPGIPHSQDGCLSGHTSLQESARLGLIPYDGAKDETKDDAKHTKDEHQDADGEKDYLRGTHKNLLACERYARADFSTQRKQHR